MPVTRSSAATRNVQWTFRQSEDYLSMTGMPLSQADRLKEAKPYPTVLLT